MAKPVFCFVVRLLLSDGRHTIQLGRESDGPSEVTYMHLVGANVITLRKSRATTKGRYVYANIRLTVLRVIKNFHRTSIH